MDASSKFKAKVTKRMKGGSLKYLTIEKVSPLFHLPLRLAAAELGICVTVLKKRCRELGIQRWPARRMLSMRRQLQATSDPTIVAELQTKIKSLLQDPSSVSTCQLPISCAGEKGALELQNSRPSSPKIIHMSSASPAVEPQFYISAENDRNPFQEEDLLLNDIKCCLDLKETQVQAPKYTFSASSGDAMHTVQDFSSTFENDVHNWAHFERSTE
jgi:hypothetical protein